MERDQKVYRTNSRVHTRSKRSTTKQRLSISSDNVRMELVYMYERIYPPQPKSGLLSYRIILMKHIYFLYNIFYRPVGFSKHHHRPLYVVLIPNIEPKHITQQPTTSLIIASSSASSSFPSRTSGHTYASYPMERGRQIIQLVSSYARDTLSSTQLHASS